MLVSLKMRLHFPLFREPAVVMTAEDIRENIDRLTVAMNGLPADEQVMTGEDFIDFFRGLEADLTKGRYCRK